MMQITKKESYKILIVEDEALTRMATETLINELEKSNSRVTFIIKVCKTFDHAHEQITSLANNTNSFDLALINHRLRHNDSKSSLVGIKLGQIIRTQMPETKILYLSAQASFRDLETIFSNINPEGFWIKSEIYSILTFNKIVTDILMGLTSFSSYVSKYLRTQANSKTRLDKTDLDILFHLSEGVKNKDLKHYVPLSQSGIERRKRKLLSILPVKSLNDTELIQTSKKLGII